MPLLIVKTKGCNTMHLSSLAMENLREYMLYAVDLSDWYTKRIGNLVLTINGRPDSLFNFVFCQDGDHEESILAAKEALAYLNAEGLETTWVIDSHMKVWQDVVLHLGLSNPTKAKKMYKKIHVSQDTPKNHPGLVLEVVDTNSALVELDELAAKIFYCNTNDLIILLRGITRREQSRLRFFIAKLYNTVVGLCGMYVHGNVVGLYSDGILPEYRNMGIASEMVLRRLQMASEQFGCTCAVAQCVTQSVSLYKRLGFRATGDLFLYPSFSG
ncbi:GNAT family N-acetyltransferase [Candidatus Anaplasma sp. TIGMIC]|uniref:GNAT family N-acetyltransferase n=1 Tax=Candidatus Anaplasma sp. TIGMIC TaxID=3020713 RepID=UPI00232CF0D7|nr:GNAT family N-acetyltransferase [Candidatus Anaplasma sp. TIGMIC]